MDQLVLQFGLNWQLLLAQMLNFGILFFVLYKFAYKPILKILDERRVRIENSLRQAKDIEEKTKKLEEDIRAQLTDARKQGEQIIKEAREIGEKSRNEILVKTNKEVTMLLEKTRADIENEKQNMMAEVKEYVLQTSLMVVEKLLSDKLDAKTREQLVAESFQSMPTRK